MRRSARPRICGFTIGEVMIAGGITAVMLSVLLVGMVALRRSYDASSYYAEALADQTRALDYIVRDCRGAMTATASADGETLTLTLPDFYTVYDTQGFPKGPTATTTPMPRGPDIAKLQNSQVVYGPNNITVSYFVSNRALIRRVQVGTNAAKDSVIATDVDNPDFNFSSTDSAVTAQITFSSRYRGGAKATDQNTVRSATIYLRNHKTS